MPATRSDQVTRLLTELDRSPAEPGRSAEELLPLLYDELRALAERRLAREAPGQTLQPTALVHEAWVRLVGEHDPGWSGRAHFFGAAARAMRRILVERARARRSAKRGGGAARVTIDADALEARAPDDDVLDLEAALERLERRDARKARVVELRHFAGLTLEEVAVALGLSLSTVKADWAFARAWLARELGASP